MTMVINFNFVALTTAKAGLTPTESRNRAEDILELIAATHGVKWHKSSRRIEMANEEKHADQSVSGKIGKKGSLTGAHVLGRVRVQDSVTGAHLIAKLKRTTLPHPISNSENPRPATNSETPKSVPEKE